MAEVLAVATRDALARSVSPRRRVAENVGDALAAAGAVALEAGWLLGERLQGPPGIPASSVKIGASWLGAALQADFVGACVGSVRCMKRSRGSTDRARLAVTYSRRGMGPQPPASIFVKLAPADPKARLFANLLRRGETEVRFYRDVAAGLALECPKVFHAQRAGRAGRFVLVCEDLLARGARFADGATVGTFEEAESVVRTLAALHASFWDSPRFERELAWSKRSRPRIERFLDTLATAVARRRIADLVPPGLPARLLAARDALAAARMRPPLTLIHGDARAENLYFVGDRAGLLDWQTARCGQGMRDVTHFLALSLPVDLRRRHERDLIALYLDALREDGGAAPDLAAALEQHRSLALDAWIAAARGAVAVPPRAEPSLRTALERSRQAILDLDSLAALDALAG